MASVPASSGDADRAATWVDMTDQLAAAVDELAGGQLIHDDGFRFNEAMSAIELMMPKMDTGMVEKVVAARAKRSDLAGREVAPEPFADALLAAHVFLLDGASAAQSLFGLTVTAMAEAEGDDGNVATVLLHAGLAASVLADTLIRDAGVFDEEDYSVAVAGFGLASRVALPPVDMVVRALDAVSALGGRLAAHAALWRQWIALLAAVDKLSTPKAGAAPRLGRAAVAKTAKLVAAVVDAAAAVGEAASSEVPEPDMLDPELNASSLPPGLPPLPDLRSPAAAAAHVAAMATRIGLALRIESAGNTLAYVQAFVRDFSNYASETDVVSRSVCRLLATAKDESELPGGATVADAVRDVLVEEVGLTAEYVEALEAHGVAAIARMWVHLVAGALVNRSRQQVATSRLLDSIVRAQNTVLAAVEPLCSATDDGRMVWTNEAIAVFTYLRHYTATVMVGHTELGFELDLYATHEFYGVFWYLEYLHGIQVECCEMMVRVITGAVNNEVAALAAVRAEPKKKKKAAKKEKAARKKAEKAVMARLKELKERLRAQMHFATLARAQQSAAYGMLALTLALTRSGRLGTSATLFGSPAHRFDMRFGVFRRLLDPAPKTYAQLQEATGELDTSEFNAAAVLESATRAFGASRTAFGKLKSEFEAAPLPFVSHHTADALGDHLRAVVTNSLASSMVLGAADQDVHFVLASEHTKHLPILVLGRKPDDAESGAGGALPLYFEP